MAAPNPTAPTPTPEARFAELVAAAPSRPFVTYYDERTGERSELSVRSLGNWVAKTHFLLQDELGLGVGDRALVALPAHWISVPAVLGALTAGLELVVAGEAEVGFVAPDTVATAAGCDEVYAIAPERAAVGFGPTPPDGCADYVGAVRPQADAWATVHRRATGTDPGLAGATRAELFERAVARARELGLEDGARVITDRGWNGAQDLVDTLLVPLAIGGSVVYVHGADVATLARRAEQERARPLG